MREGDVPAAEEERRHHRRHGEHVGVFGDEEERELHRAVLGVVAGDELRLRLRQVERQPVGLGEPRHQEDEEREEERQREPEAALLVADDLGERHVPAQQQNRDDAHPHRDLVGDHLGAGAEAAQERVLVVGRPTGERDAVDPERGEREHEEEADREVTHRHRERAMPAHQADQRKVPVEVHRNRRGPRDHPGQAERRNERDRRRQHEDHRVGAGRERLFLDDVLDPVGGGLQEAGPSHPIGAAAVLHPGAHLSLHEREERHAHHHDGEHHQHLEDAEQEETLVLRRHRAAAGIPASTTRPVRPRSR